MGNVPAVESSCRKEKKKKLQLTLNVSNLILPFFCVISQIIVELNIAPKTPNSQI
jgi:hypothetical protein